MFEELFAGLPITQQKKLGSDALKRFAARFNLPLSAEQIEAAAFVKPAADSEEMRYLMARREALGGFLPARRRNADKLTVPPLRDLFKMLLDDTGTRTLSTTMAVVRVLVAIARDKELGPRLVPIVPDEARTFGMEGMFRQIGIYNPKGQKYTGLVLSISLKKNKNR